jgi:Fe2+ transport system protein FeoA
MSRSTHSRREQGQSSERGRIAGSVLVACKGICTLATCVTGSDAMVLQMRCASPDACRLRSLGVFEGALVSIVDSRNGRLLAVRGSRLAVDEHTAHSILVRPVEAA